MAYKALYRTYRPSTFEEVAGQKHIVRTIQNALKSNKIGHAYLFAGPRGTGKTSMAKLFAKALNCEEGLGHQCNHCSNCVAINEGSHPDVIEIDAASNNGVNDVRDLIDQVKYSPIKGKYKVYIIDEVHMMSASAFNALLKTLEEPPEHVVFILATTEPEEVLPTILSRCQRYDFSKVSDEDIIERIEFILNKENITYEKNALKLIVKLADGGVRDALSSLDQVLAYSGTTLTTNDVLDLFALASNEEKINLLKAIVNGDVKTVLLKMNEFVEHGTDIRKITGDLLDILKDIIIYEGTESSELLCSLNEEEVKDISSYISNDKALAMIDILLKAIQDYKYVSNVRSLFEIVLLKLTHLYKEVDEVQEKRIIVKEVKPQIVIQKEVEKPLEVKPQKVEVIKEEIKTIEEPKFENKDNETISLFDASDLIVEDVNKYGKDEVFVLPENFILNVMIKGEKDEKRKLISNWNKLSDFTSNPILSKYASLLKDGRPYIVCKEALILEYDLETVANKVRLKNNQAQLSKLVSKILGRNVFIYSLTREETTAEVKKYRDLSQLMRLPKKENIVINIKEIK